MERKEEMKNEEVENLEPNENEEKEKKEETLKVEEKKKSKKNKNDLELLEKMKSLEEETLRAKADLINYRKRKDEEVSYILKYANADIIMLLLPVIDNFERVISKENLSDELKSYLEGFKLIYNNLLDILKANDVKEIDALGKEFDPVYHQSVTTRKDEEKPSGTVLEVYQKGYTYKDKVLRPAMVIINE